jgi:signal transduction histidine kinase
MDIKNNLYLIFKEAINNLCKYSKATKVEVEFILDATSMRMTIEDNGMGFVISELSHQGGLSNMKFRAEEFGGQLTIISELYKGTKIELYMPRFRKL